MNKTLAIIGASYLQRPLVEKAREMGLRTICFAWEEGAVCKDIADVFYPVSIVDKEKILEICREENVSGVCTIASDVAAPTVAYVAENMGLKGNSYNTAVTAHDKYLMRKAFAGGGVPCPGFREVEDTAGAAGMHYPLIVKPVDRSGSLGVTKVNDDAELERAVKAAVSGSFRKKAIVEEYVEGREVSVEFISYDGIHYPLTITDKVTTGAPHFVELAHHQPSSLPEDIQIRLYDATFKALNALGVTNGASHSEFKITDDGAIFIIETGARMGGDFIGSDLVRLSTGYDFLKGVIQAALGEFEVPMKTERSCSGVYFLSAQTPRVAEFIKNRDRYPEIVMAEITDDECRELTCSADRSGYFVYKGDRRFKICSYQL